MSREGERSIPKAFVSKAIYGVVTVLTVLQVMGEHPPTALSGAATLFGATLAVALLDAYSETIGKILAERRGITREELGEIWRDVRPVLVGAQTPTIILLLAATGLLTVERAISISERVSFIFLFAYGWRIGVLLHQHWTRRLLSGLILVAIGALIVSIKVAFH